MASFAKHYPRQISGGQKQRVALARSLVNRPRLLLLDEPLSALDANLRLEMQRELKSLQREVGITFIFVTHDQSEALAISDRVVLLRNGKVEQCGTPRSIYSTPRTAYAASFLGKSNLIPGPGSSGNGRLRSVLRSRKSRRRTSNLLTASRMHCAPAQPACPLPQTLLQNNFTGQIRY